MLDEGYGDGDLSLRLHQLKFYMRAVLNAILDYRMHCSAMTDEEALALLVDRGFLNRPEPPVWLRDVAKVECGANWLARQLAIGWLRVTTTEHRVVILTALRDPTAFAARLGDLIAEVKAKPSPLRIAAGSL